MDEEEINYRALRKIQQLEKNSPVLTSLKTNFYNDLSEYLTDLNTRSEKEPNSQKKILLKDEIQNTKKIAVNIYEQREKKILLSAVSKARGGNPDVKNMLSAEENLYNSILRSMEESRKQVLENKKCVENSESEEIQGETSDSEDEIEEINKEEKTNANTNPVLLVNQDLPEFVGTDTKKYSLKKNDVISTPRDMANMLCKRNAVENLDLYSSPECKKMPKNQ